MKYFFIILFLFFANCTFAQGDSSRRVDSLPLVDSSEIDTVSLLAPIIPKDTIRPQLKFDFTSDSFRFGNRLFFSFTNPVRYSISQKFWQGKEFLFYAIVTLLLFFAFIKNSFSRYLTDLYSSYFRTTLRQRQVKDQLLQNPLPSLLFNIFFIVSAALFLTLLLQNFGYVTGLPFWKINLYVALGLVVIYGGKFLVLKFFGWVFQLSAVTEAYIFIVFATNKIIGVTLLPFTILLAFTNGTLHSIALTLTLLILMALFAYRFFLSFISINRLIQLNIFHFLVYLAAFEILPLLLINKVLFAIIRELY